MRAWDIKGMAREGIMILERAGLYFFDYSPGGKKGMLCQKEKEVGFLHRASFTITRDTPKRCLFSSITRINMMEPCDLNLYSLYLTSRLVRLITLYWLQMVHFSFTSYAVALNIHGSAHTPSQRWTQTPKPLLLCQPPATLQHHNLNQFSRLRSPPWMRYPSAS